jgi:Spy/CpxP family protein refolding chaperone
MLAGWSAAAEFNLPPGKWWENERLIRHISLSEEQREQIDGLVYEHAHRMIDLNADVKRAELELANLVGQVDFDVDEVRAAFANFQRARANLERQRFEMLLSVREVLTAEQWQQIQDLRSDFRRRQMSSERGPQCGRPPAEQFGGPPPEPTAPQY